jgi:8-oxo-dGTP pyrophosphatase MutT (NUDIX family)
MRASAGLLFIDPLSHKVLMVQTDYKEHWDLPGGMIEPGETPRDAAVRECKEELSINTTAGPLLVCQTILVPPSLLLPQGELLTAFVFLGGNIGRNFKVDGKEVVHAAWLDQKQRYKRTSTAPIFQQRLEAAIAAYYLGCVKYLDNERNPQ